MIPVFRPSYGEDEFNAVKKTLQSGWVGLGPITTEFENAFAKYIGMRSAIATQSCTAALHLAIQALSPEGKEIITTPFTFVSTNHAILYNKATPVFCDIEPDTLNIDASRIESLISPKTAAIIVVHYGGHACDMATILDISRQYKIPVIEDVAHGCGGEYDGKKLGSLGELNCFSFHAVKNLATGEGGMITLNNPEWESRLRKLRWMGISKDTWKRSETETKYSWFYTVDEVGFKYHMSDIQATLGLVQLKRLDTMNGQRQALAHHYTSLLKSLPWITPPVEKAYAKRSWHNYVIRVRENLRDPLMKYLQDHEIATSVHYFPNHLYDLYKPYYRSLPLAEHLWKEIVTLPLYPDLTQPEVEAICSHIHDFGKRFA